MNVVSGPGDNKSLCVLHLSTDLAMFSLTKGKHRQAASESVCTNGCFPVRCVVRGTCPEPGCISCPGPAAHTPPTSRHLPGGDAVTCALR